MIQALKKERALRFSFFTFALVFLHIMSYSSFEMHGGNSKYCIFIDWEMNKYESSLPLFLSFFYKLKVLCPIGHGFTFATEKDLVTKQSLDETSHHSSSFGFVQFFLIWIASTQNFTELFVSD